MPKYAREARKDYDEGRISKVELVRHVLGEARYWSVRSRNEQLGERGIRALYRLSRRGGIGRFVTVQEIYEEAGIGKWQTASSGLWMWVEGKGCGVVETSPHGRQYRINSEFYDAVGEVLGETSGAG